MISKSKIGNSIVFMIMLFILALSISTTTYGEYIYNEDSDSGSDVSEPNFSDPNADGSGSNDVDFFDTIGYVEAYASSEIWAGGFGNWNFHANASSYSWAWSDSWWTWNEPSTPPGGYVWYSYSIDGYVYLGGEAGKNSGSAFIHSQSAVLGGVELDADFQETWKRIQLIGSGYAWAGSVGHLTWSNTRGAWYMIFTGTDFFEGEASWSVDVYGEDEVFTTNKVFGLELDAGCNVSTQGSLNTTDSAYFYGYADAWCSVSGGISFVSN